MKFKSGFSLIELVVSMSIMAVLFTIGGMKYMEHIEESNMDYVKNNLLNIQMTFQSCYLLGSLGDCNSFEKINVYIPTNKVTKRVLPTTPSTKVCFDITYKSKYKGCYSYDSSSTPPSEVMLTNKLCSNVGNCS